MKLYLNVDTNTVLVSSKGNLIESSTLVNVKQDTLIFKRGSQPSIEVYPIAMDKKPITLDSKLIFGIKPKGQFDTDYILISAVDPSVDEKGVMRWLLIPTFNSATLDLALEIDGNTKNDKSEIVVSGELSWVNQDKDCSDYSAIFPLTIQNNIIRNPDAPITSPLPGYPPASSLPSKKQIDQLIQASLPIGGTSNQVLAKFDERDFNVGWVDLPSGGEEGGSWNGGNVTNATYFNAAVHAYSIRVSNSMYFSGNGRDLALGVSSDNKLMVDGIAIGGDKQSSLISSTANGTHYGPMEYKTYNDYNTANDASTNGPAVYRLEFQNACLSINTSNNYFGVFDSKSFSNGNEQGPISLFTKDVILQCHGMDSYDYSNRLTADYEGNLLWRGNIISGGSWNGGNVTNLTKFHGEVNFFNRVSIHSYSGSPAELDVQCVSKFYGGATFSGGSTTFNGSVAFYSQVSFFNYPLISVLGYNFSDDVGLRYSDGHVQLNGASFSINHQTFLNNTLSVKSILTAWSMVEIGPTPYSKLNVQNGCGLSWDNATKKLNLHYYDSNGTQQIKALNP